MTEQQIPKLAGSIVEHQSAFNALSTEDATWAIQNTKAAIALAVEAIKNRNRTSIVSLIQKRALTPWKTIEVGGVSKKDLAKSVEKEAGYHARDLMGKPAFTVADKEEDVDLIILTPQDLGFASTPRTDEFMTKEFCAAWSEKNLDGYVIELCSPEDGPQLRRQYEDQPNGEVLWMAMERIAGSNVRPFVFDVLRSGGGERWLNGYWADPHGRWDLDVRVVFRLRKITKP